jgi:hypothetical protein
MAARHVNEHMPLCRTIDDGTWDQKATVRGAPKLAVNSSSDNAAFTQLSHYA